MNRGDAAAATRIFRGRESRTWQLSGRESRRDDADARVETGAPPPSGPRGRPKVRRARSDSGGRAERRPLVARVAPRAAPRLLAPRRQRRQINAPLVGGTRGLRLGPPLRPPAPRRRRRRRGGRIVAPDGPRPRQVPRVPARVRCFRSVAATPRSREGGDAAAPRRRIAPYHDGAGHGRREDAATAIANSAVPRRKGARATRLLPRRAASFAQVRDDNRTRLEQKSPAPAMRRTSTLFHAAVTHVINEKRDETGHNHGDGDGAGHAHDAGSDDTGCDVASRAVDDVLARDDIVTVAQLRHAVRHCRKQGGNQSGSRRRRCTGRLRRLLSR